MRLPPFKFKKNDLVRYVGRTKVGAPPPDSLGSVVRCECFDYGQGRKLTKVLVVWIKGELLGKTHTFMERDLAAVK